MATEDQEQIAACEQLLFETKRHNGETMSAYLANWRTAYRKAETRGVTLSDTLQAFLLLRRSGLSQDSRRQAFASGGGVLEVATIGRQLLSLYPDEELSQYDRQYRRRHEANFTTKDYNTKEHRPKHHKNKRHYSNAAEHDELVHDH